MEFRRRRSPFIRLNLAGWAAACAIALAGAALPAALAAQDVPSGAQPPAALPPAGAVGGMGDVNIYPKRIVIDDRRRLGTLGLYNRSVNAGEYDISLVDKLMTPEGNLVDLDTIADPAERARVRSAKGLLRWSPRRAALGGSEAQTVHVMVRVPPDLPSGEYRSHFTIVAVPPVADGLSIEDAAGAARDDGIGVRIVPRFGISIPVIVRVGETTLSAGLAGLSVGPGPQGQSIRLTVTRSGTRSAFGGITVTAPGQKTPVAEILGIGVYTEVGERQVQIPINPKADPRLYAPGARLIVTYTDDDAEPGKVLTRQEFIVP